MTTVAATHYTLATVGQPWKDGATYKRACTRCGITYNYNPRHPNPNLCKDCRPNYCRNGHDLNKVGKGPSNQCYECWAQNNPQSEHALDLAETILHVAQNNDPFTSAMILNQLKEHGYADPSVRWQVIGRIGWLIQKQAVKRVGKRGSGTYQIIDQDIFYDHLERIR